MHNLYWLVHQIIDCPEYLSTWPVTFFLVLCRHKSGSWQLNIEGLEDNFALFI